ncbi:hypothetical protein HETIRDRAFT_469097 [Heterobasidion irregulare TC 32-1]|uniref:MARVEL domain-containing protein n=1 Tax=Heterobasidion irregulare (strain TC 32-1) TaxID=747525 RepID=W4KPB8_HETIT|nr:uncharacterized protein HETIRDRAFT_469097 [Heterobasidion irregulare TC 32-1]ETW87235.1 hypothetical protein HETIRDRAFT_469097 [Heterobasidion irregulare TC 32-1]
MSKSSSFVKTHFHPFLFTLITLAAMAELGLTAFLIAAGNDSGAWLSPRYHSMQVCPLILFLFDAVWTTIFSTAYMFWIVDGAIHFLASIASSVIWLLVTSVIWGAAAGIMHQTRVGGNCANLPVISRCREALTVEALGWTEFALCILTVLSTLVWARGSNKSYVRDCLCFISLHISHLPLTAG